MEGTVYFQHYRVCTDEQGAPEQVSRSGAAINYKAVDTRSGDPVTLQLIPLTAIDPKTREALEERAEAVQKLDHVNIPKVREAGLESERFVFVSEYLQGETADSWVIAHGPLPPDAALRVALQVVRAIAAAAFHGLTHRAIQPANVMILPGAAPEGGWPFVKLLNFGVAGVELHAASGEARELAPAVPPQFASPEQLRGGEIDFRSEMYSLGATMCFLLAGAVPLAASGTSARARLRSLPELRRAPRRLRKLLGHMLHENSELRPQDPIAVEKEIQRCLGQRQPRQAVVRSLTPVAPVLPEQPTQGPTPLSQVWRGVIAVAALILLGGIAAAFFFPNLVPLRRGNSEIGKPVGVPERSTSSSAQPNTSPLTAADQPVAAPSAASAPSESSTANAPTASIARTTGAVAEASSKAPASAQQNSTANPPQAKNPASRPAASAETTTAVTDRSTQASARADQPKSAAPAEGSADQANAQQAVTAARETPTSQSSSDNSTATTAQRSVRKKKSRVATVNRKLPQGAAIDPASAAEEDEAIRHAGQVRANFVGTTRDGRVLLRLPSGEIVSVTPRGEEENSSDRRLRRHTIEREEYPRAEPVNPDDEPRD